MKFLCPKCERLVELRDFKLEGAALVLPCPACHESSRVGPSTSPVALVPPVPVPLGAGPLQLTSSQGASNVVALRSPGADAVGQAAEAARRGPFEVPRGRCPKCIAPRQPEALTCSQCGLTFAQFDAEHLAPSAWLERAWVELLEDWGREELHAEVRQRALAEQELAAVGRLYRLRLAANHEDPFAQRGRDEVVRLALMPGTARRGSVLTEKIDSKWKNVGLVAVLVVSLAVLALMARAMLSP